MRSQPPGRYNARLAAAFTDIDTMPKLLLLQRYESRLHRMYQRALDNLLVMREQKRNAQITEEPDPVSEQSAEPQTQQPETVTEQPANSAPIPFKRPELRPAPSVGHPPDNPANLEEEPAA